MAKASKKSNQNGKPELKPHQKDTTLSEETIEASPSPSSSVTAKDAKGQLLEIGTEVNCTYDKCEGHSFTVLRIHESNSCASRHLIVAHLKGEPEREIKGTVIDGINYGIDSGWFLKNI